MKYLFLLLVLTACGAPSTSAGTAATNAAETNQPAPPLDVDLTLEAFTNYAKYFKQSPRYPFILLKDGYIESDDGKDTYSVVFENAGKVIAYTNQDGGLIINDEEILLTKEQLWKTFNVDGDPFFKGETGAIIDRQNRTYEEIYDITNEVKTLKELVSYLRRSGPPQKDHPRSLLFFKLIIWSWQVDPPSLIYENISNPQEKEEFDRYFQITPNAPKLESLDILAQKQRKILDEILVLDTLEKTRIRMLNLVLLAMMVYQTEDTRYFFINREEFGDPYNPYGGNPNF